MNPLINIITRTSGRPNGFKKTTDSITGQTYGNINHIVCTDDIVNFDYIKSCGINNYHLIDREKLIKEDVNKDPGTGPYSPHNLYFNEIHEHILDGWVIYLDDDDTFTNNNCVDNIVKIINNVDEDHLIFWRMVYSNGNYLPKIINEKNPPTLSQIGGSCFTFHSKYLKYVKWDSWKCSDFRVINNLCKIVPKYVWYPENIIYVPRQGLGLKQDI